MDSNINTVHSLKVDYIITLCNLIEEFSESYISEFYSNVNELKKKSKNFTDSIYKINDIAADKKVYHAKYEKKFYEHNKEIIDIISNTTNFAEFICCSFIASTQLKNNIDYFYKYIMTNKDKVYSIRDLLNRFKELGISDVTLSDEDFSIIEYNYNTSMLYGTYYFENMYAIPTISNDLIKYRTKGSNYKLYTNNSFSIVVNNLLFNKDVLPQKLGPSLLEEIVNLQNSVQDEEQLLKDTIILDVSIDDLYNQLINTEEALNKLELVSNKKELLFIIKRINKQLNKLIQLRDSYKYSIEDLIDQNNLLEEKQKYLRRRNIIKYD